MSDATRVAIVGLGAIGGSVALKLLSRGAVPRGYSPDEGDRGLARSAGVTLVGSIEHLVVDADLVLIAVPLDQLAGVAARVMAAAPAAATILHVSSLQRPAATRFDEATARRVIGSHPLAGTAHSGFGAARPELFAGATVYIDATADRQTRDDAELFWSMAGATRIEYLAAVAHDDLMSTVSHLPQLVATALAATLAYSPATSDQLGPGGRDMTRLSAGAWSMWQPLLAATPGRTLALLETIEGELRQMRESIASGNLDEIAVTWTVARDWRLVSERRGDA